MGQKYGYFIKQCDIVPRAALRTRSQVIVAVSSQSEGGHRNDISFTMQGRDTIHEYCTA